MSTHNICFHGEIRILFIEVPLVSGGMVIQWKITSYLELLG